MAKKILIVYEKMGMGHLRMAGILEDMLKGEDVDIIKCAGSEMVEDKSTDLTVRIWNYCIKYNLIKTVDIFLNFIARIFGLPFVDAFTDKDYYDKLEEIRPDIIISTADVFNKALGTYAEEKGIPFYIFITEVSIFSDLVNPYATHICYFNETVDAIRSYNFSHTYFSYKLNKETTFLEKIHYILGCYKDFVVQAYKNSIFRNPNKPLEKLNNAKVKVVGPLAEKKHFEEKDVLSIKEKYGLDNGMDTVVLASGSIGGKGLLDMVKIIYKTYNRPLNLIVVCGTDESTYDKLKNMNEVSLSVRLLPFKFIENFDEILASADCIIGRPSAGIFIESLLNKTPEITFKKATSNDKGTLTMIEKYNIGKVIDNNYDIAEALEEILRNKKQFQDNITSLLKLYCSSYEDKKELLRNIILYSHECSYNVGECLDTEVGLNAPLSH